MDKSNKGGPSRPGTYELIKFPRSIYQQKMSKKPRLDLANAILALPAEIDILITRDLNTFDWCSIALTCKQSAKAISSAGFLTLLPVTPGQSKTFSVFWQANGFVLAPRWFDLRFCKSDYPHRSGSVFIRKVSTATITAPEATIRPRRCSRPLNHLIKCIAKPQSRSNHAATYSDYLPDKPVQAWHHERPGMSMYVSGAYLQDRDDNCLRLCSQEYDTPGGGTEDCRVLGWSRKDTPPKEDRWVALQGDAPLKGCSEVP